MVINVKFDSLIFAEGESYVAYSPHLDVSSCGKSPEEARANLRTAVRLFLEDAQEMGTLQEILQEAGYTTGDGFARPPRLLLIESMTVSVGV